MMVTIATLMRLLRARQPLEEAYTIQVEGHDVCIARLHPLFGSEEINWKRLGCTFLPRAFSAEQKAAAESLCGPFANSRSWPFEGVADPLLAPHAAPRNN